MSVLSLDDFRAELRAGRRPSGSVQRLTVAEVIPIEGAARTVRMCFSDASVDRMGDTIDPHGWALGDFRRNPVILWSHLATEPPIGRATNVFVQGDRLMGDIEFVSPDISPFADQIYKLVRGRFLNACSVGFDPIEYSLSRDPDRPFGIDFKRQALLEVSVVPIPANANALADGRAFGSGTRSALPDAAIRASALARLEPRPQQHIADRYATYDELGLMPPGWGGIWIEHQRELTRRETLRRIRVLLRLELRQRPQTLAEISASRARIAELRRAETAWE